MTPARPRRFSTTAPESRGGLTRRGFLSIALAAGAVGTWGAGPAVAAPAATTAAAPIPPERPHRTLLGVL